MSEENKAIVKGFFEELFNKHSLDSIDKFLSADYVEHMAPPGTPPGVGIFKQLFGMYLNAFPDLHTAFDDVIAEGDKVVVRSTTGGTHTAEFMGMAPTGRQFEISEIHIVRVSDGKIVEHWGSLDDMGMMQQLGFIPAE